MFNFTPEVIEDLDQGQVFVFGSNLSGRHGKGAALTAIQFGAIYRQAKGMQGSTYAIPTKDRKMQTLPIDDIAIYVNEFIDYATMTPDLEFLVTEIGCGLAGYEVQDIAPLFRKALPITNIVLPERFFNQLILDKEIVHES